ncbi:glyoxylate/hydroxypyruvate reductase A [Xylophilus rhododendri]|uniref:Glyoxylate/hydroxypyruvate reductase A n=1 Tax=Xylophilus rhododendri TaxID=2697032 RepID=A0A857J9M4_9BURK|nr:glyoxylate/hydroxypyruvate reductase A [Xylophilus rhododendri]QHI99455.1 glyoxylate/hydroxypyruvate reductase A [Xylophilus rhododendri]
MTQAAPTRIALCCSHVEGATWEAQLRSALPDTAISTWPKADPEARCAIVWSPTQAFLDAHPALEVIFNMGAGVDALLRLQLPPQARIVRIEDGGMAVQMADYVCHAVLRHFREFDVYAGSAAAGQWAPRKPRFRQDFPVGVMGLGALGRRVAESVAAFDFPVLGWSQSPKQIEGVTCLHGADQFDRFLQGTRILVNMLPLTPDTQDIMRRDTLSRLLPGAYVINVARGAHLVEDDLLALLDSGHIAGATLDVTREEPLPAGHPFWQRREIALTPHIAAQTVVQEAIAQIAAKVQAGFDRADLPGAVDPSRGY